MTSIEGTENRPGVLTRDLSSSFVHLVPDLLRASVWQSLWSFSWYSWKTKVRNRMMISSIAYWVTTAMCWWRSSVQRSSFSSSNTFCFCTGLVFGSTPGVWTSYLREWHLQTAGKDESDSLTRKHRFQSSADRGPSLERSTREEVVKQHRSHDPRAVEPISLYLHPNERWTPLAKMHRSRFNYFSHGRIVRFVLI